MNGHIVQYDDKKKDAMEGPYSVDRTVAPTLVESYHAIHLLNDDGSYPELTPAVANYLPGGVSPAEYPQGIGGWKLNRRGAFLMRDIHYGPSPVDAEDQSYFNVFFTDKPPAASHERDAAWHPRHFRNYPAPDHPGQRGQDVYHQNGDR